MMTKSYDAVLILSFGGPERHEDVLPFLENVTRGKGILRERLQQVAEHYYHFDGRSPINDHNRELIAALRVELKAHGPDLPVYWGNRNWHPYLPGTVRQMQQDGVKRAIAFATSAYSSYSSCRQYREDIAAAREEVGAGAPEIDKIRPFFNHPLFIQAAIESTKQAMETLGAGATDAPLLFSAHSIPMAMAVTCDYVAQLREASALVAKGIGREEWELVYQSRSGPPSQPWLEPDVLDRLRMLAAERARNVVVNPIGFVSDHMEVLYDLDTEAQVVADALGINLVRVPTPGHHPLFVRMVRELITERVEDKGQRAFVGDLGARPDVCSSDCCPAPVRPANTSVAKPA
jgi:protoporphyrin/coproporphyrin ferrochelatase